MIKTSPSRKHNWTSNHAIISRWRFFFEYIVFYLLDIIETISSSCFNQHKIRVKTTYPRYEAKENTIYEGTLIELRFSVFDGNSFASKSTISLSLSLFQPFYLSSIACNSIPEGGTTYNQSSIVLELYYI